MADAFKFRIDHHGSLVRPAEAAAARAGHDAGEITADERREIESAALADLVREQRNRGLSIVTDAHVRRADRFEPVSDAVKGFERRDTHRGERWIAVTGELSAAGPIVDDIDVIRSVTENAIKVNLPAPSAMAGHFWDDEASSDKWESPRQLGEALARVMRAEIERLFASGVSLIQLDNHRLAGILSPGSGPTGKLSLDDSIAVDTIAVADVAKPDHASIGICPIVAVGDDVDADAAAALFSSVPVNRWVLPFHTGADSEFTLLGAVPGDRDVCLGVVDAAVAELEELDPILDRLDRAAELRGSEDDMALSPNQGFADVATKPLLGADDQWRKLVHVETLARMFWGNEL